jgi:hypothetical protein
MDLQKGSVTLIRPKLKARDNPELPCPPAFFKVPGYGSQAAYENP